MGGNKVYNEACIDIGNANPIESSHLPCENFEKANPKGSTTGDHDRLGLAQPSACGRRWRDFKESQWFGHLKFLMFMIGVALVMLFIILLARPHPVPAPIYSVKMYDDYQLPMMTKKYEIEFYVKSTFEFDKKYPVGTPQRVQIEDTIVKEYLQLVRDYCKDEKKKHSERRDFPTPICDKLQTLHIEES